MNNHQSYFQKQLKALEQNFIGPTRLVIETFQQALYLIRTNSARVTQRDKFI